MESKYDPKVVEPKIREFWEKEEIFKFDKNDKRPVYSIDTPPPTVSGDIHLGHVFSYSQAEFIARYKRMRGFSVFYPFGLDNNGLPTEMLIEKKFNVIAEQLGREKFTELEKKEVANYNQAYIDLWKKLGLSVDWSLLYQTISDDVQKVSQKSFLDLHKMDRVYRKEDPVLYCVKEKTVISQMELEDKTLKSKLYTIKFSDDVTIATSRPELIPACVAIIVNPEDAKRKKLIGKKVKIPLFGQEVKVISDQKVDPEFGTGVVMCCTFGDVTDIEWYRKYNLELKTVIDEEGRFTYGDYKGMKIKEVREKIIEDLKAKGLVLKEEEIEHVVNVHERCGTEIEFIVKKQWYIRYLDLKDKFLELGKKVKWHPEFMRVRFENWVRGLRWDWGIARQRFVGVYFPVWYCKNCGEAIFASESELPVNPFVDKPKSKCSKCGSSEFEPEADIMDTWATSSLTPLINARWGLDKKERIAIPMGLRAQAHDIITFWAFTTVVKTWFHKQEIPWNDIMISGHALDPSGNPMHKSKGNVIYPLPYIEKYGADALRYWTSTSILGEDTSFQEKEVIAGTRLINKMWNLARFVEMYTKELDKGDGKYTLDAWILGKMDDTIEKATKNFDNYDYYKARNNVEEFFWEFANDYLEFVKYRIYENEKTAIYTVNLVLLNISKMFAPFIPYSTEELYRSAFLETGKLKKMGLEEKKSIHISSWPEKVGVDKKVYDKGMLAAEAIRQIRKQKHDNNFALNIELSKATIYGSYEKELKDTLDEIKGAMKVGEIRFLGTGSEGNVVSSIEK